MFIVITSQNKRTITPHAGKCRKFWRYELSGKEIIGKQLIEAEKEDTFSQSGLILDSLRPMDILVTAGMGDRLREKLSNIGVHVIVTQETGPGDFIKSLG